MHQLSPDPRIDGKPKVPPNVGFDQIVRSVAPEVGPGGGLTLLSRATRIADAAALLLTRRATGCTEVIPIVDVS